MRYNKATVSNESSKQQQQPLNFKKLSFGPEVQEFKQSQRVNQKKDSKNSSLVMKLDRGRSEHSDDQQDEGSNEQAYFDMQVLRDESNNSNLTPNFLSNTMGTNKVTLLSVCSQSYNSGV